MEYLFISFAKDGQDIVKRLADRLESAGYKAWLAEIVDGPGESLDRQTVFAIERSDAFLLVLSSEPVDTNRLLEQLRIAESAAKPIVSLITGSASIPPDLRQVLDGRPVLDINQDLDDGVETLVKWLEGGETVELIGNEYLGEIQRLPEENNIWIEGGYYWYKKWRNLTRIVAYLTDKRLIFFLDSRDNWKWKKNELDQLGEAFPISIPLTDIARVGQIQKPKALLIFPTSKPYVEIVTVSGDTHKITLQDNFEERVNNLQHVAGNVTTRE